MSKAWGMARVLAILVAVVAATGVAAEELEQDGKAAGPRLSDLAPPNTAARCRLPQHQRKAVLAAARLLPITESEPNGTTATADVLPLGADAGQDIDVLVSAAISPYDEYDYFKFAAVRGDYIGLATDSQFDPVAAITDAQGNILMDNDDLGGLPSLYPTTSPMPVPQNPTLNLNAALVYLVPADGDYYVRIRSYGASSGGSYTLQISKRRPYLETQDPSAKQTVFVDFDGANLNAQMLFGSGPTSADISPMNRFLTNWGLTAADENALIDKIMAEIKLRFDNLRRPNLNGDRPTDAIPGHYDVVFQNSRDNPDPFGQPNVARIVVGGTTQELGIDTIGIAQWIDPGNFDTKDTCIVLLDLMSNAATDPNSINAIQLAPGLSKLDAVGMTVASQCVHEMGHLLGNYHQENYTLPSIMDTGGIGIEFDVGAGPDMVLGNGDDTPLQFVTDVFDSWEGIAYSAFVTEATDLQTAFALSTGKGSSAGGSQGGPRPDLIISVVTFSQPPIVAGQPLSLTVTIANAGTAASGSCLLALFLNQTSAVTSSAGSVATVLVPAMNPGETKTVVVTAAYPAPGDFTLALLVDSESSVAESNEMNNMFFRPVIVFSQGVDIAITSVFTTQANPGITASFDVIIENRGAQASGPFEVGFYANQGAEPTVTSPATAIVTIGGMTSGQVTTLRFDLPPQDRPRGGIAWFFADRTNAIAEGIETNNIGRATWGVANDSFVITSPVQASVLVAGIGEPVQFTIGVTDPNNDPISYSWSFGDGTSGQGSGVTHAFATEGFYLVTVTISDGPFHIQTSQVLIEVVQEIVDLGVVRLSVKRGRFMFKLPRPAVYSPAERLKSMLMQGNPGERARYRNLRLGGIAQQKGPYIFLIEYQSKETNFIKRVRYRYTVID